MVPVTVAVAAFVGLESWFIVIVGGVVSDGCASNTIAAPRLLSKGSPTGARQSIAHSMVGSRGSVRYSPLFNEVPLR